MTRAEIDYGLGFIQWLAQRNSSPAVIGLTGGEPSLHPDFWTYLLPRLTAVRQQYQQCGIEVHTNASRPISPEKIKAFHKFFANCYVGHDMFHREFRPLNKLFLEHWAEVSHGGVTLRSNNWLLRSNGGPMPDQYAASVRIKGRAEGLLKHDKYYEIPGVTGYPRHECSWGKGDYTIVNFTPGGLINHCGEKSHPLADGSDASDWSHYTDTYDQVLNKAWDYQLRLCNKNCSQKCLVTCIAKKKV